MSMIVKHYAFPFTLNPKRFGFRGFYETYKTLFFRQNPKRFGKMDIKFQTNLGCNN